VAVTCIVNSPDIDDVRDLDGRSRLAWRASARPTHQHPLGGDTACPSRLPWALAWPYLAGGFGALQRRCSDRRGALTIPPGRRSRSRYSPYRRDTRAGFFFATSETGASLRFSIQLETEITRLMRTLIRLLRDAAPSRFWLHPERHGYFQAEPERLNAMAAARRLAADTVDSLLGNHGDEAQRRR